MFPSIMHFIASSLQRNAIAVCATVKESSSLECQGIFARTRTLIFLVFKLNIWLFLLFVIYGRQNYMARMIFLRIFLFFIFYFWYGNSRLHGEKREFHVSAKKLEVLTVCWYKKICFFCSFLTVFFLHVL